MALCAQLGQHLGDTPIGTSGTAPPYPRDIPAGLWGQHPPPQPPQPRPQPSLGTGGSSGGASSSGAFLRSPTTFCTSPSSRWRSDVSSASSSSSPSSSMPGGARGGVRGLGGGTGGVRGAGDRGLTAVRQQVVVEVEQLVADVLGHGALLLVRPRLVLQQHVDLGGGARGGWSEGPEVPWGTSPTPTTASGTFPGKSPSPSPFPVRVPGPGGGTCSWGGDRNSRVRRAVSAADMVSARISCP